MRWCIGRASGLLKALASYRSGACATAKLLGQAYTAGEIAARLKVSRWTIWRAVKALMSGTYAGDCPVCVLRGTLFPG
jgi:hypothetical protein